jgi:hypothetical protein
VTIARRLYHLARADFLERVRRYAFLITLIACVFLGYAFVPPNPSKYVTLKLADYRGVYNSAWLGTSLAMLSGTFLSLIGFYVIKNTIENDRRTGVGQILAATATSRVQYTLGKTFSNFAVLAAMTLVVALAAVGMQWLRAEDRAIDLWQMFSPFILLTMPLLMITAAIAVLFETIPGLRGGLGNVIFFFGWTALLSAGFARGESNALHNDPLGTGIAWPAMVEACARAFPSFDASQPSMSMGINIRGDGLWTLETFRWEGIHWTRRLLVWRAGWLLAGLGLAMVAAIPFDRFDSASTLTMGRRRFWKKKKRPSATDVAMSAPLDARAIHNVHLTSLGEARVAPRLVAMVRAEFRLVTNGLRWWYAGPLAVLIVSLFLPLDALRLPVLVLAFLWPVLLWSRLGTRDRIHNTAPLFDSAPRPLSRQVPATWIAGVGLSLMVSAPIAVRMMIAGELGALAGLVTGAAFVPALAMAMGIWTGSGKLFEASYLFVWYAAIQRVPGFDYLGSTDAGVRAGSPLTFAAITAVLLLVTLAGRHRRLQN